MGTSVAAAGSSARADQPPRSHVPCPGGARARTSFGLAHLGSGGTRSRARALSAGLVPSRQERAACDFLTLSYRQHPQHRQPTILRKSCTQLSTDTAQ